MPFILSSNILSWNPEDNDPGFHNIASIVKVLRINTLKFTSNQLAEYSDIPDTIAVDNDDCTVVCNDAASPVVIDLVTIEVKAVVINNEDEVRAQFDTRDNTLVTNLLVYLHDCKLYNQKQLSVQ